MILPMTLFAAAAAAAGLPARPADAPVTPQVAAERVAGCGVGPVTVRFDPMLDGDVLTAAGGGASPSDEQLACVDKAAGAYEVELPPSVQPRLDAIRAARFAAMMAVEARAWLAARDLLARLPAYRPGETDEAAFARAIGDLCDAKGAFSMRDGDMVLDPEWVKRRPVAAADAAADDDRVFACLVNAAWASGLRLGFAGNEVAEP